MLPSLARLETLFLDVLDVPPGDRTAHLAVATEDHRLRSEVLALVEAHEVSGPFDRLHERLTGSLIGASDRDMPTLSSGRRVGRYRIERVIGQGGMGTVYLATRADGEIEYRVALKMLRPDLRSVHWRRRFLDERQVLARIEHPGIARLLDAGTTDDGRPWFAMEHVEGLPITDYCDRHRLGVSRRLELFRKVCEAVGHAHRHLVVHRDIKPANVLVDPREEVKLLDFGIAKVLDPTPTPTQGSAPESYDGARTVPDVRIMTPEYAAPEQLVGGPVTTLTDVYQLGLLLHILLFGRLPERPPSTADSSGLGSDPPAASSEVALVGARDSGAAEVARLRDTTPPLLRRRLRGDLEAVLVRSLAVRPVDRYSSVEQLSEDVRRHLEGLPLRARSARSGYLVRTFVQRHRFAVLSAATIAALILTLAVGSTIHAVRISEERDRARQLSDLLVSIFESARPAVARGDPPDALELLDMGAERARASLEEHPEVGASMFGVLSDVQYDLGSYDEAVALGWDAVEAWAAVAGPDDPRTVDRLTRVAAALGAAGMADSAQRVAERALELAPWTSGPTSVIRGRALQARAYAFQLRGERREAELILDSALVLYRRAPGDSARVALASALVNRGWLHENEGALDLGIASLQESLAIRRALLQPDHPATLNTLVGLAEMRMRAGAVDSAAALLEHAVERVRTYYGAGHPRYAGVLLSQARALERLEQLERAEAAYLDALQGLESADEASRVGRAHAHNDFGRFLLHRRGRAVEAMWHFARATSEFAASRGEDDAWAAAARGNLAAALLETGDGREAERVARRSVEQLDTGDPATERFLIAPLTTLGLALRALDRAAEAEPLLRRALSMQRAAGDSVRIARAEAALGLALHDAGKGEGVELLRRSVYEVERHLPAYDPVRRRVSESGFSMDAGRDVVGSVTPLRP